ncbi:Hypothetical protein NTJ_01860 [Nesidiocoris tenuis]|uniref:Uncharacterized protein n=1 Tax=Nesidiocoris tenuis TaxID=355587 RepID=A0ABN7A9R2_9HEMI|nr:Hypothetical protein NTJ_01860 [Nesidiocoris tenuis]
MYTALQNPCSPFEAAFSLFNGSCTGTWKRELSNPPVPADRPAPPGGTPPRSRDRPRPKSYHFAHGGFLMFFESTRSAIEADPCRLLGP